MSGHIDPNGIYNSREVALELFGWTDVERFYAYRKTDGLLEGFPQPLSRTGHPRWSGVRLLAWRDRIADPAPVLPETAAGKVVDMRPLLRARSRALAGQALARRG